MRLKRKLLSVIMTAAMITTLFAGLTITANAYSGSGTVADPYLISNESDLTSITNLSASYKLTADIYISSPSTWNPIGTGTSSTTMFSGTFDGDGHTIYWGTATQIANGTQVTATGGSYWGVFGSSSGVIANVNVAGNLKLTGSSGSYVSPLVGYSSGSVYNCVNSTDFSAENMDNAGGVVGAMENTSGSLSPIYLQYCGNTGDITASKRAGGVVGAVYCSVEGNVVVDQCYSKDCTIYTKTSGSKVWSGGLAGYVKGDISNCYTDNIVLHASGGRYLSGLVGILNGSNPPASATNCYANVATYTGCAIGYDRPFVGSVDNTSAVELTNCYWTENNSSYTQPTTTSGNWGTWTGGGKIDGTTITWANLSLGSLFTTGSSASHPVLNFQNDSTFTFNVSNGTAGGSNTSTVTFNGGNETALLATIASAGSGGTIVMNGAATISSAQQIYDGVTFIRGTVSGALFNINPGSSNTVRMTSMTVNGNGSGTLFDVASGTLQLRGNITLTNCATAVNVQSGATVEVNKASITATNYSIYNAGSFILNDFGNTSIGGDVYLASGKKIDVGETIPSGGVSVISVDTDSETVIADGGTSYTLTEDDTSRLSVKDIYSSTLDFYLDTDSNQIKIS